MKKIATHLWFDKEAKEAAAFYTSVFKDSRITSSSVLHNTPSGDVDVLTMELSGQDFMLISAGPLFKFNPSVSFMVACATKEEVDELWGKLSPGGKALMELGEYPFSGRFGWIQDKFGLSWQMMFMDEKPITQKITPMMMFVGEQCGRAEEAMNHYASIFRDTKISVNMRYAAGEGPDKEGTVKHATFTLEGQEFMAMDSAHKHEFAFNEAISFVVRCKDQAEIDHYWQLSAVPESEQCGWLKDKFGFSWQITPTAMDEMMSGGDQAKIDRVTEAFLKMKKFDIAELEKAAEGK